jgi:tetratricopeptide (TPR) repeat protein
MFNMGQLMDWRDDFLPAESYFARAEIALQLTWLDVEHVFGPCCRAPEFTAFQMAVETVWTAHQVGSPEWVAGMRDVLLWQTRRKLSDLGLAMGKLDQAVKYARLAIEMRPDDAIGWACLARALRYTDDREGCVNAYVKALRYAPFVETLWLEALPLLGEIGGELCTQQTRIAENIARACPRLLAMRNWFGME